MLHIQSILQKLYLHAEVDNYCIVKASIGKFQITMHGCGYPCQHLSINRSDNKFRLAGPSLGMCGMIDRTGPPILRGLQIWSIYTIYVF